LRFFNYIGMKRKMCYITKKTAIILSLLLTFPIAILHGQSENEQENLAKVVEMEMNAHYSIRLKQVSEDEYMIQKKESEHLRHEPYKEVTNVAEARKMLGKKVKSVEVYNEEGDYLYPAVEITFKDGVKKRFDWRTLDEYGFIAYYPELRILILNHEASGDHPIDLNNSTNEHVGNPHYSALSPDKQLRIAGYFPGGAVDGVQYFLEKWNPKKKKYEFIDDFKDYFEEEGDVIFFLFATDWFWADNSKTFFRIGTYMGGYYEMEIIAK